jgi:hypothetical protein
MSDIGFPTSDMEDVKIIFQNISPRFSGNTAFNGIQKRLINDGFEMVLIESISPYGVKLDQVPSEGWRKNNRRTGQPLEGWFIRVCKIAGMHYLRGKGGNFTNMNLIRERMAQEALDNPLRQRIFAHYVAERGLSDVNVTK